MFSDAKSMTDIEDLPGISQQGTTNIGQHWNITTGDNTHRTTLGSLYSNNSYVPFVTNFSSSINVACLIFYKKICL